MITFEMGYPVQELLNYDRNKKRTTLILVKKKEEKEKKTIYLSSLSTPFKLLRSNNPMKEPSIGLIAPKEVSN